jgi:hypothetical protein
MKISSGENLKSSLRSIRTPRKLINLKNWRTSWNKSNRFAIRTWTISSSEEKTSTNWCRRAKTWATWVWTSTSRPRRQIQDAAPSLDHSDVYLSIKKMFTIIRFNSLSWTWQTQTSASSRLAFDFELEWWVANGSPDCCRRAW